MILLLFPLPLSFPWVGFVCDRWRGDSSYNSTPVRGAGKRINSEINTIFPQEKEGGKKIEMEANEDDEKTAKRNEGREREIKCK